MNKVVLQIVMRSGHLSGLLVTRERANEIINAWKSKQNKLQGRDYVEGVDLNGVVYAIEERSIVSIFALPDGGGPQAAPNPYATLSGRN